MIGHHGVYAVSSQVSRFKGFIIGGGGLFEAQHYPLHCSEFVASIDQDLPIAIFGVGARLVYC